MAAAARLCDRADDGAMRNTAVVREALAGVAARSDGTAVCKRDAAIKLIVESRCPSPLGYSRAVAAFAA